MNIVFVADIETSGGATACLLRVTRDLVRLGHECSVLLPADSWLVSALEEVGVRSVVTRHGAFLQGRPSGVLKTVVKYPVRAVGYWRGFKRSIECAERAVDFSRVDVIHTNVNRNDLGAELARRHGIPHVWHLREFSDLDFNCWSYRPRYVDYMAHNADRFIAVSHTVRTYFLQKGIPGDKLIVVNDGIDVDGYLVARTRWKESPVEFALVGGVSEAKGQRVVIEALALVPDAMRQMMHVTLCGAGARGYVTQLKAEARRLGVIDQVTFAGPVSNVIHVLSTSDYGLMCSQNEAFGLVFVEYMATGLPVIAANSGACREFFNAGAVGLLFDAGSREDLARALVEAVERRESLSLAAEVNAKLAATRYSQELNTRRILEVYGSICGGLS